MADSNLTNSPVLSLCATTGERVKELPIEDGQLIFIHDKHRIALDYNGKRKFYNQIEEIGTELERRAILAPVSGRFYFVIDTAILWVYQEDWVQVTSKPEEIVFIGTEIPELGQEQTLYVNKAAKEISVWDNGTQSYIIVSDYTNEVTDEDIDGLFGVA